MQIVVTGVEICGGNSALTWSHGRQLRVHSWTNRVGMDNFPSGDFLPIDNSQQYTPTYGWDRFNLQQHRAPDGKRSAAKRKDAGSTPGFCSPFSSKRVIYGHCPVILPCTINETFKWLASLPICPCCNHSDGDSVAVRFKLPLPSYCRYYFCEPDVKLD